MINRALTTIGVFIFLSIATQAQVSSQDSVTIDNDSIFFNKNKYYFKSGEKISGKELRQKLESLKDDSINYLLKKHDKRLLAADAFAFGGGFIIGVTLADDQFDSGTKTGLIIGGIGVIVTSVIYGRSRFHFIHDAIRRHNYLITKYQNQKRL